MKVLIGFMIFAFVAATLGFSNDRWNRTWVMVAVASVCAASYLSLRVI